MIEIKMLHRLLFQVFLLPIISLAQSNINILKGLLILEKGEPLVFASIQIKENTVGTSPNKEVILKK
tara:strand:- start:1097 stop:1297 length:201 start_codon:yes stop_codon:yes gene_type:complete